MPNVGSSFVTTAAASASRTGSEFAALSESKPSRSAQYSAMSPPPVSALDGVADHLTPRALLVAPRLSAPSDHRLIRLAVENPRVGALDDLVRLAGAVTADHLLDGLGIGSRSSARAFVTPRCFRFVFAVFVRSGSLKFTAVAVSARNLVTAATSADLFTAILFSLPWAGLAAQGGPV